MAPSHPPGVDAHCHLDSPVFDPDRSEILARGRAAGVGTCMLAAAAPDQWPRLRRVAHEHGLPFAVGVHPWWPDPDAVARLPEALEEACALGEIGLDRLRAGDDDAWKAQQAVFEAQLDLAEGLDLPLVLHAVRAVTPVLDALEGRGLRGQLHGFVRGDLDRALALGLHISFGPDLVRSPRARDAMRRVPHDRLLLETDAPDRPLEGDRGEPAHLRAVAEVVAHAWGARVEDVLQTTGANARSLFGWEAPST